MAWVKNIIYYILNFSMIIETATCIFNYTQASKLIIICIFRTSKSIARSRY